MDFGELNPGNTNNSPDVFRIKNETDHEVTIDIVALGAIEGSIRVTLDGDTFCQIKAYVTVIDKGNAPKNDEDPGKEDDKKKPKEGNYGHGDGAAVTLDGNETTATTVPDLDLQVTPDAQLPPELADDPAAQN